MGQNMKKSLSSLEIRQKFIQFFVKNGHTEVASSSLIPAQDPTLLFANAGMNQFKDVFLGLEKRSYTRAVSLQKCIRAGGKHNDLENVGFTKRHLTFFEMMGNFSFGDYFKKDAIRFAWDFLTQDIGLEAEKLYASVYQYDDEAYAIWRNEIGLPEGKIVRLGEADNFWQMGDTGPCGPCSEIYIDRGLTYGCGQKECAPGCSCDRFLEIWNLVFMQFDRQAGGVDKPLKQTGVDTGMGLERLCAVAQNKDSVFETDIFEPLLIKIEQLTGKKYTGADSATQAAFRVLADHVRSSSFAIADGCSPSNEGRGYVLRKIIRRAALFAQKLSDKNFFPQVAVALVDSMGSIYPELVTNKSLIVNVLTSEIEKFSQNLVSGQAILEKYFVEQDSGKTISGAQAFKLYDTYGFPLELTKLIAQERGFTVDHAGFESEMEQQRLQSGKKQTAQAQVAIDESLTTTFTGYDELETETEISAIICESTPVQVAPPGERCWFITPRSPFYVECGGQISDTGSVAVNGQTYSVLGVKKIGSAIALEVQPITEIPIGSKIKLMVDAQARTNTMKNHTATHLLQAALIQVVGKSVKQSGSLVTPDYLRFDFTHYENLTPEQIKRVEDLVNAKIMENIPLNITQSTLKDATAQGVIAFFGEKYNPEKVRVVAIPGFSAELCGGTHVRATGDIGCFKITETSSLSAGNRRIVALTGPAAVQLFQEDFAIVKNLSQEYKAPAPELLGALTRQREQLKELQQQLARARQQLYRAQLPVWLQQAEQVGSVSYGYISLENASAQELRDIAQDLLKVKPGLYCLISVAGDRIQFLVATSQDLSAKLSMKDLAELLKSLGLKGGATATMIQGGGVAVPPKLKETIREWLAARS
jgi:alanyl-tRNA synthetase